MTDYRQAFIDLMTAGAYKMLRLRMERHCRLNHSEVLGCGLCGCFSCGTTFEPGQIKEWVDDGQTALCPTCGCDFVVADCADGFPVTPQFMKAFSEMEHLLPPDMVYGMAAAGQFDANALFVGVAHYVGAFNPDEPRREHANLLETVLLRLGEVWEHEGEAQTLTLVLLRTDDGLVLRFGLNGCLESEDDLNDPGSISQILLDDGPVREMWEIAPLWPESDPAL